MRSQRARLFDAVAHAVSERGYAATPVAEILRRAGVSRRTFYEQFANKDECFLAAYDQVTRLLVTEVLRTYREPGAWEDRLRRAMGTMLALLAAEPAFARMCLVEVLAAGDEAMRHHSVTLGRFVPMFAGGDADTVAVPSVVGQAIIAGIVGIVREEIVAGRTVGLPDLLPHVMFFAVAPLAGLDAARRHLESDEDGA